MTSSTGTASGAARFPGRAVHALGQGGKGVAEVAVGDDPGESWALEHGQLIDPMLLHHRAGWATESRGFTLITGCFIHWRTRMASGSPANTLPRGEHGGDEADSGRRAGRSDRPPSPRIGNCAGRLASGRGGILRRQRHGEHRLSRPAGERDPPAHALDGELAEGEAESRVVRGLVDGRPTAAAELLEDQPPGPRRRCRDRSRSRAA